MMAKKQDRETKPEPAPLQAPRDVPRMTLTINSGGRTYVNESGERISAPESEGSDNAEKP